MHHEYIQTICLHEVGINALGSIVFCACLFQTETGDFMPQLNLDKCGTESGCVTHPKDCSADDCNFAISYFPVVGGIRFRLLNKQAKSLQSYVGMGISRDQKMVNFIWDTDKSVSIIETIFCAPLYRCISNSFRIFERGMVKKNWDFIGK